jgi:hypothetical protein
MYLWNRSSPELSGGCKPVGSHTTPTRERGEATISGREMRTAKTATRSRPRLPQPTDLCVRAVPLAFEHLRPELGVLPDGRRVSVPAAEAILHPAFREGEVLQRTPPAEASQRVGRVGTPRHDFVEVAKRAD